MATDVDGSVKLTAVRNGETRSLAEWTTMFHLAVVVVDPFTYESSWILDTGRRILSVYAEADCRVGFVVTGTAEQARQFLGPIVDEYFVLADPDREAVRSMGLETLPAFVHIDQSPAVAGKAEGWDPDEWRVVAEGLTEVMSWQTPVIPAASDPVPFDGTPAQG